MRLFNLGVLPSEGSHKTDFRYLFEVRQLVLFMMMNTFPPKAQKEATSVLIKVISALVTLNAGAAFQTCGQYLNDIFF